MRFPLRLWSTYSSLRWTGLFWQSEQAHLSEQVPTHIIQSFIYRRIYYFSEPSEAAVWFLVRSRVNQFLSACKVNLNAETTACMSVLTFRNFRLFSWKFMPQSFVVLQKLFIRSFSWYTIGGFDSHDSVNFKWIWTNWNNIHEKKSCMFRDYSTITVVFAAFLLRPGDTVRISLMYLLDEKLFDGASFQLLNGIPEVITGDTECHNKVEHLPNQSLFNRFWVQIFY